MLPYFELFSFTTAAPWLTLAAAAFVAGERPACLMERPLLVHVAPLSLQWLAPSIARFQERSGLEMSLVEKPVAQLDFAGIDSPGAPDFILSATIIVKPSSRDIAVPLLAAPIYVMYNIPGLGADAPRLNLTMPVLLRVLRGNITDWSDPALTSGNPALVAALGGAGLPIVRVQRGDFSAATGELVHELVVDDWGTLFDDARLLAAFRTNPAAAWAAVSVPGAPPPVGCSSTSVSTPPP